MTAKREWKEEGRKLLEPQPTKNHNNRFYTTNHNDNYGPPSTPLHTYSIQAPTPLNYRHPR